MECKNCSKTVDRDSVVSCGGCQNNYCAECAEKMAICECAGDFHYYS